VEEPLSEQPGFVDLQILEDVSDLRVEEGPANSIIVHLKGAVYENASAVWAFPFTDRRHWIQVRDSDENPRGLISAIHDVERASRDVLQRSLERRYFLPKIQRVHSTREEFGLLTVDADTDRGRISFTINNPRENIHWVGQTRFLFVAPEENRYEIPDVEALDAKSRALIANVV